MNYTLFLTNYPMEIPMNEKMEIALLRAENARLHSIIYRLLRLFHIFSLREQKSSERPQGFARNPIDLYGQNSGQV